MKYIFMVLARFGSLLGEAVSEEKNGNELRGKRRGGLEGNSTVGLDKEIRE
jgi:hypothetical protein